VGLGGHADINPHIRILRRILKWFPFFERYAYRRLPHNGTGIGTVI